MTTDGLLLGLLLGLALGAVAGWAVATRLAAARREAAVADAVRRAGAEVAAARAELDVERRALGRHDGALREAVRAASAEAMAGNAEQFAALAASRVREVTSVLAAGAEADDAARAQSLRALLDPVAGALGRMEAQMRTAEQERESAFVALREQVGAVATGAAGVAGETRALVTALRAPHVRGRWGELQLERVVDLAGMVEHCDFTRQAHARGQDDDGALRPDLVVHLAGGKQVVVDAKVPFAAYLESTEARDDATRRERAAAHARQVRAHVDALGAKAYWRRFDPTPEFVVMFVPGEVFLSAALEADPTLLEHAFGADVVLATPTTLVALLRTVAYAWRQESLARNTAEVHALGRELHTRLGVLSGHLGKLGRSLDAGVRSFNETVSSLESRVLVSARRFTDLSVTTGTLDAPEQIERRTRAPADTGGASDEPHDPEDDDAGSSPWTARRTG